MSDKATCRPHDKPCCEECIHDNWTLAMLIGREEGAREAATIVATAAAGLFIVGKDDEANRLRDLLRKLQSIADKNLQAADDERRQQGFIK